MFSHPLLLLELQTEQKEATSPDKPFLKTRRTEIGFFLVPIFNNVYFFGTSVLDGEK